MSDGTDTGGGDLGPEAPADNHTIGVGRALFLAALYGALGLFIVVFSFAGRRPWTGIATLFLLTWAFQIHVCGRPWGELGLSLSRRGLVEWIVGAAAGAFLLSAVVLVMAGTGAATVRRAVLAHGSPGAAAPAAGSHEALILLAALALIEEMLFRGFPLLTLARAMGPARALVVSSVIFTAAHVANPGAGPLGLLGVFLAGSLMGAIYLRWRSLWASWGCHFAWNAAQGIGFGAPISGLPIGALKGASMLATTLRGPAWWTGAAFGLEGSLPAILILAAALWGLIKLYPIKLWSAAGPISTDPPDAFSRRTGTS